jgi:hypothetical protein
MLTSENKLIKEGRHVGLDFYDLLIEALIDTRSVNSPMSILLRWREGRGVPHDVTAGEPHYSQESKGGPGGRLLSDHVRANVVYFG